MTKTTTTLLMGSALLAALALANPAWAQDDETAEAPEQTEAPAEAEAAEESEEDEVEEIEVTTARKRKESIFETPAALTVVGNSDVERLNISNVDDVSKYVPNLNITRFGVGNTSQAAVFIRGIGLQDHLITTDPGVGVYLDGVYLGRQMGNNLSLVNIERIEVLRGPQGTLYGRNTLGGAVNIITRQPGDESVSQVQLQAGTRDRLGANFYSNFRLGKSFSMSATGGYKHRAGVGDAINLPNPEKRIGEINEFFGRVAAKWEPSDSFRITATVDGMNAENGQSPSTIEVIGAPAPDLGLPQLTNDDIPSRDDTATTVEGLETTSNRAIGASLVFDLDLAPTWSAKLLTSYRRTEYSGGLDDDVTSFNLSEFPETGDAEQFSGELQLNGRADRLDVVGGIYYFFEDGSNYSGPFTFTPFNNANLDNGDFFELNQRTWAFAIYANAGYALTDALSVGAGIRYSLDEKRANALFPSFGGNREFREAKFNAITWDFNATYKLRDNLSVYAQVQRGYQTGGFPPRPFGGPAQFNIFDEITALNYETGIKGILNDNAVLFLSAFWTEYDDLALPFSQPQEGGFVTIVENAGSSRARGIEIEANLTAGGFFLNPSLGYIDAEITEVLEGTVGIEEGASPALTPRWTIAANAGYVHDFDYGAQFRVQADYSYRGEQFGQSVESLSELMDSRQLVGFNIQYLNPDRDWQLDLYGENIFNEVYDQGRLNNTFHGFVGVVLSNDRSEFGLRFTKRFGL